MAEGVRHVIRLGPTRAVGVRDSQIKPSLISKLQKRTGEQTLDQEEF